MAYTRTRDWATVDYYAALGVATDASDDEIARAFRALAKQLHPDAGVPVDVAERFKEVTAAYEVLGNRRARRDYDAVRASVLVPAPVGAASPVGTAGVPPRFRAAPPRPAGWTLRRAWAAFVGGVLVLVLGVVVSLFVAALQRAEQEDRAGRVRTTAVRIAGGDAGTIQFRTERGEVVRTAEPEQQNPGRRGTTVDVLYDPDEPTDVIADENHAARDITLWTVAVKLLVGGPVFAVIGWRALRRERRALTAVR